MTIELNDESYIVGIWFSSNPHTNNDWMGGIARDPDNPNRYIGWSRFRYTRDDKIFDSEDEKSWTDFTSQEGATDEDMIRFMELAQSEIAPGYPDKDSIIVRGSLKELMGLAASKSWMNIKQVEE